MTLTTDDLRALRDEATPGPWFARETYVHDKHVWFDAEGSRHGDTPNVAFDCDTEANARLIALAPDLATRVIEQDARIAWLEEALIRISIEAKGTGTPNESLRVVRTVAMAALEDGQ